MVSLQILFGTRQPVIFSSSTSFSMKNSNKIENTILCIGKAEYKLSWFLEKDTCDKIHESETITSPLRQLSVPILIIQFCVLKPLCFPSFFLSLSVYVNLFCFGHSSHKHRFVYHLVIIKYVLLPQNLLCQLCLCKQTQVHRDFTHFISESNAILCLDSYLS